MPLWDLESDYNLHNNSLHPPSNQLYQLLYDEILKDSKLLRESKMKNRLETTIKRAITNQPTSTSTSNLITNTTDESNALMLSQKNGSFDDNTSSSPLNSPSGSVSRKSGKSVGDDGSVRPSRPILSREELIKKYYIRHLLDLQEHLLQQSLTSSPATATAGQEETSQRLQKQRRQLVNQSVRAIARLERRQLLRKIVSQKIAKVAQRWWKLAIVGYQTLYERIHILNEPVGTQQMVSTPQILSFPTQSAQVTTTSSNSTEYSNVNTGHSESVTVHRPPRKVLTHISEVIRASEAFDQLLPAESYYSRFYRLQELTEFDQLLSFEFFAPIELVSDAAEVMIQTKPSKAPGQDTENSSTTTNQTTMNTTNSGSRESLTMRSSILPNHPSRQQQDDQSRGSISVLPESANVNAVEDLLIDSNALYRNNVQRNNNNINANNTIPFNNSSKSNINPDETDQQTAAAAESEGMNTARYLTALFYYPSSILASTLNNTSSGSQEPNSTSTSNQDLHSAGSHLSSSQRPQHGSISSNSSRYRKDTMQSAIEDENNNNNNANNNAQNNGNNNTIMSTMIGR